MLEQNPGKSLTHSVFDTLLLQLSDTLHKTLPLHSIQIMSTRKTATRTATATTRGGTRGR